MKESGEAGGPGGGGVKQTQDFSHRRQVIMFRVKPKVNGCYITVIHCDVTLITQCCSGVY